MFYLAALNEGTTEEFQKSFYDILCTKYAPNEYQKLMLFTPYLISSDTKMKYIQKRQVGKTYLTYFKIIKETFKLGTYHLTKEKIFELDPDCCTIQQSKYFINQFIIVLYDYAEYISFERINHYSLKLSKV